MKTLETAPLYGKTVLLRIDANVPLKGDERITVADDYRLRAVLPTIHYLLDYGAKVVVLSHLGRPGGKYDRSLSLRPVYLRLSALLKKPVKFAPTLFTQATKDAITALNSGEVLGLENLRFDPGEEKNSRTLAQKLSKYGDLYVNDAFAVSHREAASLVAITELLPSYAGLLMERELQMLSGLMKHPDRPFIGIVGGAKIKDKLPVLRFLAQRADWLLIGGAIANTFLVAQGEDVKDSLYDKDFVDEANDILRRARGKLVLPVDYRWQQERIMDIGPSTAEMFGRYLTRAHTVFWAGPLGLFEDPEFKKGSASVAHSLLTSKATTVIGGGDTVSFLNHEHIEQKFSFISTGGSATLEFISGKSLPGIRALG